MTATPAYGFKIGKSANKKAGPMTEALKSGRPGDVRGLLAARFPTLKFAEAETENTEIERPEDTVATAAPLTNVVGETAGETTTASLYNNYMAEMPGGVRELVTTDYKGTRGGRLGRGNYTTQSLIPGAQVQAPSVTPASAAPSAGGGSVTTYNAPVVGGNWQQFYGDYYGGDVNYGTIGGGGETSTSASTPAAAQPTGAGFTPAWAKQGNQRAVTTSKAGSGKVASTTNYGSYVAPSSSSAPATAQKAAAAVSQAISSGSGLGVKAAAASGGDPGRIGGNAAAALVAEGGSASAQRALKQADKGKIELTNSARKALEKAADKDKKK